MHLYVYCVPEICLCICLSFWHTHTHTHTHTVNSEHLIYKGILCYQHVLKVKTPLGTEPSSQSISMARSYSQVSKSNKIEVDKETHHLQQVSNTENLKYKHISEIGLVHALLKIYSIIKLGVVNITWSYSNKAHSHCFTYNNPMSFIAKICAICSYRYLYQSPTTCSAVSC